MATIRLATEADAEQVQAIYAPVVRDTATSFETEAPTAFEIRERILRTTECYVVPHVNGEIVVGATVEERGFDTTVTAGGVHDLLRAAYRVLPELAELELVEASAGFRPGTPDNLPVVRRVDDRLVLATGHFRNGILLTATAANAVADLVVDERVPA